MDSPLLLAHAASVLVLTGVVWTVQLVVYPAFLLAGPTHAWPAYHRAHSTAITRVVGLPWAVQGATCALFLLDPDPLRLAACVLGALTVVLTLAQQVPLHTWLAQGWDEALARRLVRTNLVRTAVWTAAAAVALALLARA